MSRTNAREAAMRLLYQKDMADVLSVDEYTLNEMQDEFRLNDKDVKYIRLIVDRFDASKPTIDNYIKTYSRDWSFERLARVDLAIMRLAICEMINFSDIPRNASINEAVELAKKYGDAKAKAFVNGVLASVYNDIVSHAEVDRYNS